MEGGDRIPYFVGLFELLLEDGVDDVVDANGYDLGEAHRLEDVLPHHFGNVNHAVTRS
jgi:hypothetical protein